MMARIRERVIAEFYEEGPSHLRDAIESGWPLIQFLASFPDSVIAPGQPACMLSDVNDVHPALVALHTAGYLDTKTDEALPPALRPAEGASMVNRAEVATFHSVLSGAYGAASPGRKDDVQRLIVVAEAALERNLDLLLHWRRYRSSIFGFKNDNERGLALVAGSFDAEQIEHALKTKSVEFFAALTGTHAEADSWRSLREKNERGHFCEVQALSSLTSRTGEVTTYNDPRAVAALRYVLDLSKIPLDPWLRPEINHQVHELTAAQVEALGAAARRAITGPLEDEALAGMTTRAGISISEHERPDGPFADDVRHVAGAIAEVLGVPRKADEVVVILVCEENAA
jgi:hypothetical protein